MNDDIDRMRHSATRSLLERNDVIVVASVRLPSTSLAFVLIILYYRRTTFLWTRYFAQKLKFWSSKQDPGT